MKLNIRMVVLLLLILVLSGCQKNSPPQGKASVRKLSVVTTLFPLYDFARNICGDKADVTLLLPPGVEAHSFEPKPADLITISKADVFIYTNAVMEPWATKLLKGVAQPSLTVVDASKGAAMLTAGKPAHEEKGHGGDEHDHAGGVDPHIWLDFKNAAIMIDNLTAGIITKDPANAQYYTANVSAYKAELQKLDADFSAGLASCGKRTFLHGGHYAFGYLANRYGLTYRSAQAVNPDAEPTPSTIAELLKLVKADGLKYVYAEELVSPRIADMIVKETGVKILTLHGAHNISKDDLAGGATFIGLMRKNLESLRVGLLCR
ncbi:MAG TPA: zinc ABC transporter substrate-binding protein [Desulfuromonadales bacterium]|nr:zinc ABC transporter substrate-binding protein [Desulfuromonadales bacterium]